MERGNRVGFFHFALGFLTAPSSARSRWHPAKLQVTGSEKSNPGGFFTQCMAEPQKRAGKGRVDKLNGQVEGNVPGKSQRHKQLQGDYSREISLNVSSALALHPARHCQRQDWVVPLRSPGTPQDSWHTPACQGDATLWHSVFGFCVPCSLLQALSSGLGAGKGCYQLKETPCHKITPRISANCTAQRILQAFTFRVAHPMDFSLLSHKKKLSPASSLAPALIQILAYWMS